MRVIGRAIWAWARSAGALLGDSACRISPEAQGGEAIARNWRVRLHTTADVGRPFSEWEVVTQPEQVAQIRYASSAALRP